MRSSLALNSESRGLPLSGEKPIKMPGARGSGGIFAKSARSWARSISPTQPVHYPDFQSIAEND